MTQNQLNVLAEKYLNEYVEISKSSSPYEIKGIFHSELLMAITIIGEYHPEQVIESGRARGQSTEIIARYCGRRNIEFHSVEINKESEDVIIAEKRLEELPVKLHYGDSFELIPKLIGDKKTFVLIDGPKGKKMWELSETVLNFPNVLGTLLHDTPQGTWIRDMIKKRGPHITSDNSEYVKRFRHLDKICWRVNPWGPYMRNNKKGKSYGPTLSFIV